MIIRLDCHDRLNTSLAMTRVEAESTAFHLHNVIEMSFDILLLIPHTRVHA